MNGEPEAGSRLLCYRLEPWAFPLPGGPLEQGFPATFAKVAGPGAQTTAGFTLYWAMLRLRSAGRGLPQGHSGVATDTLPTAGSLGLPYSRPQVS